MHDEGRRPYARTMLCDLDFEGWLFQPVPRVHDPMTPKYIFGTVWALD